MTSDVLDRLQLVRSRDAAAVLGVSRRQLDRLVAAGTLKPVRLSREFDPTVVESLVAHVRTRSAVEAA